MSSSSKYVRLNKYLAAAGLGSRRACEKLILEGAVTINGKVVKDLSTQVRPTDRVVYQSIPVQAEQTMTLAFNKPKNVMCTADEHEKRKTIFDYIPVDFPRLFYVGRLDYESEGLLIMTNDGTLSQKLTHPKFKLPKVYLVRIDRAVEPDHIKEFLKGMQIEEGFAKMDSVYSIKPTLLRITLSQGLKRQIRQMLGRYKYDVEQLKRVQIGNYRLNPKVKEGAFKHLDEEELKQLLTAPEKLGKGAEFDEESDLPKHSLRALKAKKIALNQSRYGQKENRVQVSKGKGRAPDLSKRSEPSEDVSDKPTFVRYSKSSEDRGRSSRPTSRPPYKPRASSEYSSSRPGKTFEEKSADRRRTSDDRRSAPQRGSYNKFSRDDRSDSRRPTSRPEYGARSDRGPRSDSRRDDARPRRSSTGSSSSSNSYSRGERSDSRRPTSSRSEFSSRSDRAPRSDSPRRDDSRSPRRSSGPSSSSTFNKFSRDSRSDSRRSSTRPEYGTRSDRAPRSDSPRRDDSRSRPSSSTGRPFNKFKNPSRSGNTFKKKY
jgi:23S rRNA pseudouridine2605 synthase